MWIDIIKDEIFEAILEAWPNVTCYQEEVPQGFETPAFCVLALSPSHVGGQGLRARRDYPFIVQYFAPESPDARSECEEIGERLIDVLEFVKGGVAELRRGSDINFDLSDDGVLTFRITYPVIVQRKPKHYEKMQKLTHREVVKNAGYDEKDRGSSPRAGNRDAENEGSAFQSISADQVHEICQLRRDFDGA